MKAILNVNTFDRELLGTQGNYTRLSVEHWRPFSCCELPDCGRRGMYQMEKITTGVSYTTSAVGTGYRFLQLPDRVSPSQWAAIGVLGSLLFGLRTYLTKPVF